MPPPPEVDDIELLAAIAAGDDAAASTFVRRHQASVVRFLARMLGAHDPAVDDLTQLTFVAALQTASGFRSQSAARSWLIGIAHNKAKMHLRSRMRRRRMADVFTIFRRTQPDAEDHPAETHELARRLTAAIDTLDPDRRAVFVLVDIEGMTCRDAAGALGKPEGTVRRWRMEARRALQPLLDDLRPQDAP